MNLKLSSIAFFSALALLGSSIAAQGCELFGLSSAEPVPPTSEISMLFKADSKNHPDGWGLALYIDGAAIVFKEPGLAANSPLVDFLLKYPPLKSKLYVAHIRKASVGGASYQNTHPFVREWKGREYVLAHNGTLRGYQGKLELNGFQPTGINDSEFLLCWLLGRMKSSGLEKLDGEASFSWLQGELRKINAFGQLNCILSDGESLFAYRDINGYSNLRVCQGLPGRLDEASSAAPQKAFSVATNALNYGLRWSPIEPGHLEVFKDGARVFQAP